MIFLKRKNDLMPGAAKLTEGRSGEGHFSGRLLPAILKWKATRLK